MHTRRGRVVALVYLALIVVWVAYQAARGSWLLAVAVVLAAALMLPAHFHTLRARRRAVLAGNPGGAVFQVVVDGGSRRTLVAWAGSEKGVRRDEALVAISPEHVQLWSATSPPNLLLTLSKSSLTGVELSTFGDLSVVLERGGRRAIIDARNRAWPLGSDTPVRDALHRSLADFHGAMVAPHAGGTSTL